MTKDETQELCKTGPQPGEIYQHYKGGLYSVVARAIKEDTLEPLVIYQSNAKRSVWARTLDNFTSSVEVGDDSPVQRFERVNY